MQETSLVVLSYMQLVFIFEIVVGHCKKTIYFQTITKKFILRELSFKLNVVVAFGDIET